MDAAGTPRPMIIVCGKYGTGKSTAAERIHGHLPGYDRIGIDETRQRMGLVVYRHEDTPSVMRHMWSEIERSLGSGRGVIADRPHQTSGSRQISYDQALSHGRMMILIETVCPEEVARARIAARPSSGEMHLPGNDPSIYARIKRRWEPVEADFRADPSLRLVLSHIRYDTALAKANALSSVPSHTSFIGAVCGILESLPSQ